MTPTIRASSTTQAMIPECCMCGDSGLSHELFHCKFCKFRSQHRYCSNLYPKAEYYRVCNWCLSEKDKKNSQNSSSSTKTSGEGDIKRNNIQGGLKGRSRNSPLKPSSPSKKVQRSPENLWEKIVMNKKHVFRNKVRRYKLLEEVSSL